LGKAIEPPACSPNRVSLVLMHASHQGALKKLHVGKGALDDTRVQKEHNQQSPPRDAEGIQHHC
jgi:hypothetical protein